MQFPHRVLILAWPLAPVGSSISQGVSLPLEQPLVKGEEAREGSVGRGEGEDVTGLASPELMLTGELPLLLLPRTPPRPRELAPPPPPSSLVLKLENLLMLITFFISLRVALGVARRLPFVSPEINISSVIESSQITSRSNEHE